MLFKKLSGRWIAAFGKTVARSAPDCRKPLRRFLRFTPEILKPGSPLQRLHPVSVDRARERADPHPYMDKAPVSRVDPSNRTHAPSSLQNIRLSSAAANPLSGSQY